jgi:hypothetical protein
MKTFIVLCLLPLPLLADAPKKPLQSRYTSLHASSPFTTPAPPIINNTPVVNPLEDWALGGVTKFPDGYFVILLNKKKPDEKKVIQPGMHSEFEVIEVTDGGMDYTETTVKLRYGSSQGTVSFDKKLLVVKSPSQNPAQEGQQAGQPALPNGLPGGSPTTGGRLPPRIRTLVQPGQGQPTPGQPQQGQIPQVQPQ